MTLTPDDLRKRVQPLIDTYGLTDREITITLYRAAGIPDALICERVGIAIGTFRATTWKIKTKLAVHLPALTRHRLTVERLNGIVCYVAVGRPPAWINRWLEERQ